MKVKYSKTDKDLTNKMCTIFFLIVKNFCDFFSVFVRFFRCYKLTRSLSNLEFRKDYLYISFLCVRLCIAIANVRLNAIQMKIPAKKEDLSRAKESKCYKLIISHTISTLYD